MGKIYHNLIKKHNREIPFTILVYFFATFIIVRSLVYAWTYNLIPELNLIIKGVEIHHLNFGIFILAFVGFWLLVRQTDRFKIAKIYGIGLALAFDEFGMWLHLEDDYWVRQSYDGIIIITVLLLNIIYLGHIWQRIFEQHKRLGRKILEKNQKQEMTSLIDNLIQNGWLKTPRLINAFRAIKRANFMPARNASPRLHSEAGGPASPSQGGPKELEHLAELNEALSIGYGQTISQPLTVAFILELLQPEIGDKVLDIGSGSGWTTALLAYIVSQKGNPPKAESIKAGPPHSESVGGIIAIELIPELMEFGKSNVSKYSFIEKGIVEFICADGSKGYKKEAPFDKILASAAVQDEIPRTWKEQLKIGGRIVTPIGSSIWLFIKKSESEFEEQEYPGFAFVPLIEK